MRRKACWVDNGGVSVDGRQSPNMRRISQCDSKRTGYGLPFIDVGAFIPPVQRASSPSGRT